MILWSIGWSLLVVFGIRNCKLMDFRLSMLVWAEQWIKPIPQIIDSSSMLSYSIDIQLVKMLCPWSTVGFEIFQLPKVWFFLNHPCWTWLERSTFPWIFFTPMTFFTFQLKCFIWHRFVKVTQSHRHWKYHKPCNFSLNLEVYFSASRHKYLYQQRHFHHS